jgi:hypothetical protein
MSQCGLCNWVIMLRNLQGKTLAFHVVDHLGRTIFLYKPSSFKRCFAKTWLTRVQLVEISGFFCGFKTFVENFQNFSLICQSLHLKHTQKKSKKITKFCYQVAKICPPKETLLEI